jgi:hypothetical protein
MDLMQVYNGRCVSLPCDLGCTSPLRLSISESSKVCFFGQQYTDI